MGWDSVFSERAQNGDLTVGIIGLGYVGRRFGHMMAAAE